MLKKYHNRSGMDHKVSIIIPVYNRQDLLGETLNSVLKQSHENWECIIVDDGSEDNTGQVGRDYATRDGRISFLERPIKRSKGAASCRNFGLEKVKGDFIQFLDSDDILHPEKLEKQLNEERDGSLLTGKWGYFSGQNLMERFKHQQKCYRSFRDPLRLLACFGKNDEFLPLHSFLIPTKIVKDSGNWKEDLGNNDDAEFMSRVVMSSKRVKFVPDAFVFYRVEGKDTLSGFSTIENAKSAVASLRYMERNLSDYPKIRKRYLGNLKANIGEKIRKSFPELYEKNPVLWS